MLCFSPLLFLSSTTVLKDACDQFHPIKSFWFMNLLLCVPYKIPIKCMLEIWGSLSESEQFDKFSAISLHRYVHLFLHWWIVTAAKYPMLKFQPIFKTLDPHTVQLSCKVTQAVNLSGGCKCSGYVNLS